MTAADSLLREDEEPEQFFSLRQIRNKSVFTLNADVENQLIAALIGLAVAVDTGALRKD